MISYGTLVSIISPVAGQSKSGRHEKVATRWYVRQLTVPGQLFTLTVRSMGLRRIRPVLAKAIEAGLDGLFQHPIRIRGTSSMQANR